MHARVQGSAFRVQGSGFRVRLGLDRIKLNVASRVLFGGFRRDESTLHVGLSDFKRFTTTSFPKWGLGFLQGGALLLH